MNAALWWLAQNTLTVALMVPLVLMACRVFRNRPAVQHMLWLVVLLKFVTPPLVSWPWTMEQMQEAIWSPQGVASLVAETPGAYPISTTRIPGELEEGVAADQSAMTGSAAGAGASSAPVASVGPNAAWLTLRIVAILWIAGAAVCLLSQIRRIARHASLVRRGAAAPDLLTDEVRSVAVQLGLRPPRALVAREIVSPFVWCLGRLRLVWPECLASKAEVVRSRGVIAHELAHVRRGDHLVAWLELAAGIIWWWNPLFWFVRRRLRETAEMACDALAIDTCPENRREYAELLLALSAGCKTGAPAPVLAVSAGAPSSFERRLSMILSDRVSGEVSLGGVLAALCLALATLPSWSLGQQRPAKERPPLAEAPKSSPAEDALLRELIENGKFAEAKDRLEMLRKNLETEKEAARRELERWKATKIKELPHFCIAGVKDHVTLTWKSCKSCHMDPWEEPKVKERRPTPSGDNELPKKTRIGDSPVASGNDATSFDRDEARPIIGFKGDQRFYIVTFEGQGAAIAALNIDDGRILWRSHFADSLPNRSSQDLWSVGEPGEKKEVVLSWNRNQGRTNYYFDTATGKILRQEMDLAANRRQTNDLDADRPARNTPGPLPTEAAQAQREAAKAEYERALRQFDNALAGQREANEARRAAAAADYERALNQFNKSLSDQEREAAGAKRQASGTTDAAGSERGMSTLDLAERYLRALADLKNATSKHARLQKLSGSGTVSEHQLEESKIELERVQKLEKLLSSFMEDELKAAQAAKEKAHVEYRRAEQLHAKQYMSATEIEATKFRLEAAEIRFRQLDSIRSAVTPPSDNSKPSTGSGTGTSRGDGKSSR